MQIIKDALQEVEEQETQNKLTTLKQTEIQDTQQNINLNNLKTNNENDNEEDTDEPQFLPKNKKTVLKWLYTHFNNKNKIKSLKKLSFLDTLRKETGEEATQKNDMSKSKNLNLQKPPNQKSNTDINQQNEDQTSQKNDKDDKQKIIKGIEQTNQEYIPCDIEDQKSCKNVNDQILYIILIFNITANC